MIKLQDNPTRGCRCRLFGRRDVTNPLPLQLDIIEGCVWHGFSEGWLYLREVSMVYLLNNVRREEHYRLTAADVYFSNVGLWSLINYIIGMKVVVLYCLCGWLIFGDALASHVHCSRWHDRIIYRTFLGDYIVSFVHLHIDICEVFHRNGCVLALYCKGRN